MLPIAERWFERRSVGDGVTLLIEPHVDPLLRCNIWHVRGRDRDLLVDTGLGVAPLRDAARDLFEKPLAAVATHTHLDHTGGMHEFTERWVHELEADILTRGSDRFPLDAADISKGLRASLAATGYEVRGGMLTAIPHEGYVPRAHRPMPALPTRRLAGGDIVDLGDRSFEVLHLPGHSPGSIGLWDARNRVLFSGDAIYDGPLFDDLPGSNIPEYVATMKRLRALRVEVVHGGHDPSFGRERLVQLCDAYLARRDS